jgi:hypothetical protein
MSILPTANPQAHSACGLCSQSNSESAQDYFILLASNSSGIADYFKSKKQNLLIGIHDQKEHRRFATENIHEITLSFAVAPTGRNVDPIKDLLLFGDAQRHRTFSANEYRFSFPQVFELKALAWAIAIAYRKLGYQCRIVCGGEEIDVDGLIADASPSALERKLETVTLAPSPSIAWLR